MKPLNFLKIRAVMKNIETKAVFTKTKINNE